MILRLILALLIFAAIAGGLGYVKYQQIQAGIAAGAAFQPPPEAVTSAKAEPSDWQQTYDAVGEFAPVQGVTIGSEEEGKVTSIFFESGAQVQKDDLLATLDSAVEEAELKSAVARAENALTQLRRLERLKGTGALAESELDNADAELRRASADGERLKAIINRKNIRAPFNGRLGIRQVQLGQYLGKGDAIVELQSLTPIYFNFPLPQQSLSSIQVGQAIRLQVDAFAGESFSGTITAIDPRLDREARTLQLQATLENKDERLRPGMFARVSVLVGDAISQITIPATAINRAPYGNSVFILEKMTSATGQEYLGARQQFVKLGASRGDQVAILEGLKADEEVATSGLFKLRPNAAVQIDNSVTPTNSAAPKPDES
jgi:membrane fusion protein, multidrug efflux system